MSAVRMIGTRFYIVVLAMIVLSGELSRAAQANLEKLEAEFKGNVLPLLKQYCLGCHSTEKQKGDLDLERFFSFNEVSKHPRPWENVVEQVSLGEMPPKEKPQPKSEERQRLIDWVNNALTEIALTRAGDPGPVLL